MYKKGFTLIELLVVIAIIGILSSVVFASLGGAKTKNADSTVKSSMTQMRTQAEVVYGATQSYTGLCTGVGGPEVDKFAAMLYKATSTGGGPSTSITTYCQADNMEWSIYSQLKSGGYWCVGSSGAAKATSSPVSPWTSTSCR
jgi:prepilin-type N-terminal cleavage/methylation domain-containing protein